MVNYANSKIYRIVNDVDDFEYVGSTTQPLSKRLVGHKQDAKKHPESRVYKHLNNIGWENVNIILIEEYSCENREQLERRERYFIEERTFILNFIIPTRTNKEWREDNAEIITEKKKIYYKDNAEIITEKKKIYRANNIETIKQRKHDDYEKK
jgi:group I intron endonuclease